ncbi:HNH endonuclease signature motif containing protein, partial [Mycobacterium alsense]|uniref:HNH endonuclease signature motif containing protein n=1 Tax=Mycobacterium alsense TaxID=324058 RepID=UPI000AF39CF8
LRRRHARQQDRQVWIGDVGAGMAALEASLFGVDARALDQRLTALAGTVCAHDPRTVGQRRADALGALAAGADRLGCRCARPECPAGGRAGASTVVVHVIAEQASLDGTASVPGSTWGADGLIPPELIAELATTAKPVALVHPADAPPEPGYVPSQALADFVRCRDLTCRWPGCDQPATRCEIDHTIPHAAGGPTHAGNLKCLCPTHHLVKTFWGWRDQQLPDGTLIFTSPSGQTYVTTPASALLFPSLCHAVGGMGCVEADPRPDDSAERTAMMPRRRRTRAQDRAYRVATERRHNRTARQTHQTHKSQTGDYFALPPPTGDEDPPPF